MEYRTNEGEIAVYIRKNIFSKEALLKCFYWYSAQYEIGFAADEDDCFVVRLKPVEPANHTIEELVVKLRRDLVDFQLRETIAKETYHVRNLLVAKAFAHEEDPEPPASEITDPVGFDPLSISHE